jgi:cytochrome c oxidase subunit 4
MTDTTLAPTHDQGPHAKHHPSDLDYVKIAFGLAVITALEVIWSYQNVHGAELVVPLLVMMAIKFFTVASRFMHLHFDDKLLSRVFFAGIILACFVFTAAMTTLHIWQQ